MGFNNEERPGQRAPGPDFIGDVTDIPVAATSTGHTDTTVTPGVSYYYRIRAENAAGYSAWAVTGPVCVYLLAPAGLDETDLDRLLRQILTHRVDYADLYFQYSRHESWSLEEGQEKSGSYNVEVLVSLHPQQYHTQHLLDPYVQRKCPSL